MRTSMASAMGCRLIVAAALAAVAGCGALQPPGGTVVRYEYKRPDGRAYVRVEKIEPDAPPNDASGAIRPEQLRMALAGVREKATILAADETVLSVDELDELAPRRASPRRWRPRRRPRTSPSACWARTACSAHTRRRRRRRAASSSAAAS